MPTGDKNCIILKMFCTVFKSFKNFRLTLLSETLLVRNGVSKKKKKSQISVSLTIFKLFQISVHLAHLSGRKAYRHGDFFISCTVFKTCGHKFWQLVALWFEGHEIWWICCLYCKLIAVKIALFFRNFWQFDPAGKKKSERLGKANFSFSICGHELHMGTGVGVWKSHICENSQTGSWWRHMNSWKSWD